MNYLQWGTAAIIAIYTVRDNCGKNKTLGTQI